MNQTPETPLTRLQKIFAEHADKRICVVGVSCIGKTTLLRDLPECIDGDDVVWDNLPEDVYIKLITSPTPWKPEILAIWREWYIKTDFDIQPGRPAFSVWVEPCDLVVYLTLREDEYIKRVLKRKRNPENMLAAKAELEKVVKECGLPVIVVEMFEG